MSLSHARLLAGVIAAGGIIGLAALWLPIATIAINFGPLGSGTATGWRALSFPLWGAPSIIGTVALDGAAIGLLVWVSGAVAGLVRRWPGAIQAGLAALGLLALAGPAVFALAPVMLRGAYVVTPFGYLAPALWLSFPLAVGALRGAVASWRRWPVARGGDALPLLVGYGVVAAVLAVGEAFAAATTSLNAMPFITQTEPLYKTGMVFVAVPLVVVGATAALIAIGLRAPATPPEITAGRTLAASLTLLIGVLALLAMVLALTPVTHFEIGGLALLGGGFVSLAGGVAVRAGAAGIAASR